MSETQPLLRCDECGTAISDLTLLGQWHQCHPRMGVLRLEAPAAPSAGASLPPEIVAALETLISKERQHAVAQHQMYARRSEKLTQEATDARAALESAIASRLRTQEPT